MIFMQMTLNSTVKIFAVSGHLVARWMDLRGRFRGT